MAAVETINLLDYLAVIVKYRRMVALTTSAAFVLSIVISLLLPKVYSSTARILAPQQESGLASLMGQAGAGTLTTGDLLGKSTSADMYAGILRSEAVKDAVIDRFNLMKVYRQKYRIDTYKEIDNKSTIVTGKRDGIVSITVEDKDPARAAEMANGFVDELGRIVAALNVSGAGQSRIFLEGRLALVKADLARAEEALRSFSMKNKAIQVSEQAKLTIEGIARLKAQLAAQEVNLATYQNYLTDSSQEIKNAKAGISSLKSQIARLEGTDSTGAILPVGSVPTLVQEYTQLMREYKTQESLLDLLTKQYEMYKLSEAKNFPSIQIIQKARVSDKKSKPKRVRIVLASTFVVFFASILAAFVREYVDQVPMGEKERCMVLFRQLFRIRWV